MTTRVARRTRQSIDGIAPLELPAAITIIELCRQLQETFTGSCTIAARRQLQLQLKLQQRDGLPPGLGISRPVKSLFEQLVCLLWILSRKELSRPAQPLGADPASSTTKQQHRSSIKRFARSSLVIRQLIQAVALDGQLLLLESRNVAIHQAP